MVIEREQNMVNCINTEVRVSFYHFGDLHWKPSSSSNSSNENQQQISQRWHHDPKSKVLMEVEDETLSRGLDLLRTLEPQLAVINSGWWLVFPHPFENLWNLKPCLKIMKPQRSGVNIKKTYLRPPRIKKHIQNTYPPGYYHVPSLERENYLQNCLFRGYVSFQEGISKLQVFARASRNQFFCSKASSVFGEKKHAGKIMGKELLPVKTANHTCYVAFW